MLRSAWLLVLALALAPRLPAQTTGADAATRHLLLSAIVSGLSPELIAGASDTVRHPWIIFPRDSSGTWSRERQVLVRLLNARDREAADRGYQVLSLDSLTVRGDTVDARFAVTIYVRCARDWTARGTEYAVRADRLSAGSAPWARVTRYWDGLDCAELDRRPARDSSARTSPPHLARPHPST